MWSKNRTVDITVNILLFCVGLNIFHYGQALLPIICLIIFINNRFKLNINNMTVFIILCAFGLSFFAFSYKLGFYGIVGLCLPMAYYIGSNLKEKSEKNVIKVIYILALGMAFHVILNFGYELILLGSSTFNKIHHYDIWTRKHISSTGTAINYTFLIGVIYYSIFYEKNKLLKYLTIVSFVILFIYNFALGRRTPILMLLISIAISYVLDIYIYKSRKVNKKLIKIIGIVIVSVIACVVMLYVININDFRTKFIFINLILKFYNFGLNPERLQIFLNGVSLMPKHLWGGQYISKILDSQIHDLWMDTYDYAGIVPFILLIVYSILSIKDIVLTINNRINNKCLFIVLFLCILMQMLLEPVITGSSIFLISTILIISSFTSISQ